MNCSEIVNFGFKYQYISGDMTTVKTQVYSLLDGTRKKLVHQVGDGSIITRFDKTPVPKEKTDVVCPHFLELKWAYGCPFDCAWCFLKGTFRFLPTKTKPIVKDYRKVELHLRSFFENNGYSKELLNSGELADSLLSENMSPPFSTFIHSIVKGEENHKILFLTKSTNVENICELDAQKEFVMSFSLNAIPVSETWEKAPKPIDRIKAAKKVYDIGYETRVRIDPMVPIENYQKHYARLVDDIFSNLKPARVTVGSLRGLQSTINNVTDRSWIGYLDEWSNWGRKISSEKRYEMYKFLIDYLRDRYNYRDVALCKETIEMWEKLGMNYKRIRCNCIW